MRYKVSETHVNELDNVYNVEDLMNEQSRSTSGHLINDVAPMSLAGTAA